MVEKTNFYLNCISLISFIKLQECVNIRSLFITKYDKYRTEYHPCLSFQDLQIYFETTDAEQKAARFVQTAHKLSVIEEIF